jgi:hypothetical protein
MVRNIEDVDVFDKSDVMSYSVENINYYTRYIFNKLFAIYKSSTFRNV